MKNVYALFTYEPETVEYMDKAAKAIMEDRGGQEIGAGTFMPTGERDIQYQIEDSKVDDAVAALEKAGFRTKVTEIRG